MNRRSDSFAWGIRWEKIDRENENPLYGVELPVVHPTLGDPQTELHRLEREHPTKPNPLGGFGYRPVRYVVFARTGDDVAGGDLSAES